MTAVLHVSREVADALPAGLSIAPVEGRRCPQCERPVVDAGGDWQCHPCRSLWPADSPDVLPPVLSGRIAIAVDGAIIGTATATAVVPLGVKPSPRSACGFREYEDHVCFDAWTNTLLRFRRDGIDSYTEFLPALDLSPDQWVVTIEDWAPAERCPFGHDDPAIFRAEDINSDAPLDGTRLAADIAATVPEANRDLRRAEWRAELRARTRARRKCRFCMFGEPVPVATAPVGTITTWDAG